MEVCEVILGGEDWGGVEGSGGEGRMFGGECCLGQPKKLFSSRLDCLEICEFYDHVSTRGPSIVGARSTVI